MNELLKINEQLMNAPAGVIVALFAIALGYVLKTAAFFPNNRIPLVIVLFTAIVFPLVQYCAAVAAIPADELARPIGLGEAKLKVPLNLLIGFIIGFAAWLFHAKVLKRWLDPKLFSDGNQIPGQDSAPDSDEGTKL